MKYYEDPILGKGRAADVSGGTGGGGGTSYIAGDGLNLAGGTISLATAEVQDVLNGTQTVEAVDVSALRGALTAGQAVDVTSQPDNAGANYKGEFEWNSQSLGFASFPKFASGLKYLLIADLTYFSSLSDGSGSVTPYGGTWLNGATSTVTLDDGVKTRVALLFDSASIALNFTYSEAIDNVIVSNLREYEVTSCTPDAIAYIAALSNPDEFQDYYLVKRDQVSPWTYIIDMGTSPAVTIASGLSYKLNANRTHQLTVDTLPVGYDGRDAIIRITLGGSGVIQAVPPLQLGNALTPYAINNCVVRYRDGEAVLLVEDTLAGYLVTLTSGTGYGSLPYGLATTGVPYIAFSPSTDGIPVNISGATTAAEDVMVVGNGYEETILTGSIRCTSKTIMANLALSDVQVVGGTLTLGDAYIPSGSTVAVNGGKLIVEKVSGNGGTINLGGTSANVSGTINGVVFYGGTIRLGNSGVATNAGISSGTLACSASAYANNTSVYGSGTLYVGDISSGGIVYLGGIAYVNPGGTANDYNVSSGGLLAVYSGGNANNAIAFPSGSLRVSSGGTMSAAVISSGGSLYVYNGGTANEPIITSGGSLRVSSGGTALLVTSNAGALVTVSSGGYITYKE